MDTRAFFNGTIAIGLDSINELLAAKQLGMFLCDGNGYYFDDDVEDEDGVDREPTEEEKTNRAIDELRDGCRVFATMYAPNGYELVEKKSTTLQSNFFVGQKVYTMIDNKITEVTIMYISLASGNLSSSDFDRALSSVANSLYYTIGFSFCNSLETYVPSDKEKVIKNSVKKYAMGNQIIASYSKNGAALYDTFPIGEVFATKEELVKHLMGED